MALSKYPIQVYLDERQNRALRRFAERENTTISDLIRRSVDLLLASAPAESDPAYHLIGLFSSGLHDLAEKHEEYLAGEIEEERK